MRSLVGGRAARLVLRAVVAGRRTRVGARICSRMCGNEAAAVHGFATAEVEILVLRSKSGPEAITEQPVGVHREQDRRQFNKNMGGTI